MVKSLFDFRRPLRRSRGQSIVEMAVFSPVLVALLLMGVDTGVYIYDKITASGAARHGARLAATLGGLQANPTWSTSDVDSRIVADVIGIGQLLDYASIQEIDIYRPTIDPTGRYATGDPVDVYDGNGVLQGTPTYTIDLRNQSPPYETAIGVRVVWLYRPPTGMIGAPFPFNEYAVYLASPVINT